MRQTKFNLGKTGVTFGGSNLRSAPKTARPIDTKSAMHLTLKTSRGVLRLPKTMRAVNLEVARVCRKYDFTLYKYSNNYNHLHILLRVTNRFRWKAFIRELTGVLARVVRLICKIEGGFWLGRPFTRIIKGWGRNYKRVREYIELNIIEANCGLTRAQARLLLKLRSEFG